MTPQALLPSGPRLRPLAHMSPCQHAHSRLRRAIATPHPYGHRAAGAPPYSILDTLVSHALVSSLRPLVHVSPCQRAHSRLRRLPTSGHPVLVPSFTYLVPSFTCPPILVSSRPRSLKLPAPADRRYPPARLASCAGSVERRRSSRRLAYGYRASSAPPASPTDALVVG